jgi:hypothetical protein
LFIQTLLPLNPSASAVYGAGNLNPIAELEPTQYIYTVQDPSLPVDTRFLHVLQGADPAVAMSPATYLESSSGTAFDGAVFGSAAVFFPVSATAPFAATTLTVPAGVHSALVTGLAPGATYSASSQSSGASNVISIASNSTGYTADAAGVLVLTF